MSLLCTALLGVLLTAVPPVDAFFRMSCGRIQTGRIDPIITPGGVAGHCHLISGPISRWQHDLLSAITDISKISIPHLHSTPSRPLIVHLVASSRTRARIGHRSCTTDSPTEHMSMCLQEARWSTT
jgi:hypothetical protein